MRDIHISALMNEFENGLEQWYGPNSPQPAESDKFVLAALKDVIAAYRATPNFERALINESEEDGLRSVFSEIAASIGHLYEAAEKAKTDPEVERTYYAPA